MKIPKAVQAQKNTKEKYLSLQGLFFLSVHLWTRLIITVHRTVFHHSLPCHSFSPSKTGLHLLLKLLTAATPTTPEAGINHHVLKQIITGQINTLMEFRAPKPPSQQAAEKPPADCTSQSSPRIVQPQAVSPWRAPLHTKREEAFRHSDLSPLGKGPIQISMPQAQQSFERAFSVLSHRSGQ